MADQLSDLIVPYGNDEHRMAQFSPRYRLAFSLLNEDATQGKAAFGWDIRDAISSSSGYFLDLEHIQTLLQIILLQ